jgi:hypothetical protein
VITDTHKNEDLALIHGLLRPMLSPRFHYDIEIFWNPEDPKQMTWIHKQLFDKAFLPDNSFTHFLYLEDDIRFTRLNLEYWLEYRYKLEPAGLIPSFVRYEFNRKSSDIRLTDCIRPTRILGNLIDISGEYFLSPDNPYSAMYLLDRPLAEEYRASRSFDREQSKLVIGWPATERSAMGLCFEQIPQGRTCRIVVPFNPDNKLPYFSCLIHHLPNNFTNGETPTFEYPFGALPLADAFD